MSPLSNLYFGWWRWPSWGRSSWPLRRPPQERIGNGNGLGQRSKVGLESSRLPPFFKCHGSYQWQQKKQLLPPKRRGLSSCGLSFLPFLPFLLLAKTCLTLLGLCEEMTKKRPFFRWRRLRTRLSRTSPMSASRMSTMFSPKTLKRQLSWRFVGRTQEVSLLPGDDTPFYSTDGGPKRLKRPMVTKEVFCFEGVVCTEPLPNGECGDTAASKKGHEGAHTTSRPRPLKVGVQSYVCVCEDACVCLHTSG